MIGPRIFHISTSVKGGAGIAALKQHNALLSQGYDSHFLTLDNIGLEISDEIHSIERTFQEKVVGKLFTYLQQRFNNYTFFSTFSQSSSKLLTFLKEQTGDQKILQIHNWYNFFDLAWAQELENLGFRIIFTLHDQRLLTGGCHYTGSCIQFEAQCNSCPAAPLIFRKSIHRNKKLILSSFRSIEDLHFIAPSLWIAQESEKSGLLRKANLQVIPNYFPVVEFSSVKEKTFFSSEQKIKIGIASISPFAEIKGGKFLRQLMESGIHFDFVFLTDFAQSPKSFWDNIDCLLVPSLQDNSPNVIHEAKVNGVPVVARKVGGIPEILSRDYDLTIEHTITPPEFVSAVSKYFDILQEIPNLREQIRIDYADFSKASLADYLRFIEETLKK